MAAAFSRAAGYCTEKSEGHRAGLEAQRGVAGLGFCLVMFLEEDIHTCPAAYVTGCEAGSGGGNRRTCARPFSPALLWGGSLSTLDSSYHSQYSRTCPAAYVYGSAAGKGGVGGNLLRTVSFGLWEGGHGGNHLRRFLRPLQREAKRSEGPESRRECVREGRCSDQATRTGP